MRFQKLLILLLILASLLPAYSINQWLKKRMEPKRSFGRFLAYMLLSFLFVFGYTFVIATVLFKLFPPAKK